MATDKIITVEYIKHAGQWTVRIEKDGQICRIEGISSKAIAKKSANEILSFMRNSHTIKVIR